jgi:thiamine-monophosphate kinase
MAGERELIETIRKRALQTGLRKKGILSLGIGDDCAILRPRRNQEVVVTTDLSLENVHFNRQWHPPESVGHRCLARGLSDLAAMGARPEAAFLSLALPEELTGEWRERFFNGLLALAERCQVPLAGGDTAKAPMVIADIVLLGSVPRGEALLRSGARAGDLLYVTGTLGGSAAELLALEQQPANLDGTSNASHPHLYPEPRLAAGRKVRKLATAAIDVSDGLSTDLAHLCDESGLSAEIDAAALPVDARATLEQALHGGEDYELLFAAPPKTLIPNRLGGVSLHPIGRLKKRGKGPHLTLDRDGVRTELVAAGWEHFR